MIDPQVAYDKLAQMSCKEMVDFFEQEGIQGVREGLYSCPIARWIRETTGEVFSVSDRIRTGLSENWDDSWPLTSAMEEFISLFDGGQLVSLDEDYETVDQY